MKVMEVFFPKLLSFIDLRDLLVFVYGMNCNDKNFTYNHLGHM